MPYASLTAGLIVAAALPVANLARLQKAVATQKVRTEQGAERQKRKRADERKGHQIDRRKKYTRERDTRVPTESGRCEEGKSRCEGREGSAGASTGCDCD